MASRLRPHRTTPTILGYVVPQPSGLLLGLGRFMPPAYMTQRPRTQRACCGAVVAADMGCVRSKRSASPRLALPSSGSGNSAPYPTSTMSSQVPLRDGELRDGAAEPATARVKDGRILLVFRHETGARFSDCLGYYASYSTTEGESWGVPQLIGAGKLWAVRPWLLLLANGVLLLSGGRPCIFLHMSTDGSCEAWETFYLAAEAQRRLDTAGRGWVGIPKLCCVRSTR